MILENAPVSESAASAAPVTENTGEFGYKSSAPAAPAEPVVPSQPAVPSTETVVDTATPATVPANADAAPEDDNWFSVPGTEPENGVKSGAPGEQPAVIEAPDKEVSTDWKNVIKGVSREEILKELGVEDDDDFLKEFKKHIKNGGNPVDYLEARGRDWSKVDDTTLAMKALAEDNPTLSKEELTLLFEDTYFQDEDATDREKSLGNIRLKSDAERKRRAEIEKQKQFTIPDNPVPAADEEAVLAKYREKYIQEAEQTVKADNEAYMADPTTQAILQSKKVTVPLGKDGKFTIGIDPAIITGYFTDPEVYNKYQFGEGGKPDMQTEQAIAAIRILGLGEYNQYLVAYAKEQAKKSIVEEGQNISKGGNATPPAASKGPVTWRETGGN